MTIHILNSVCSLLNQCKFRMVGGHFLDFGEAGGSCESGDSGDFGENLNSGETCDSVETCNSA